MAKLPATRGEQGLTQQSESDELRALLLGWLAAKKEATQRTYRFDLADFARWWQKPGIDEALLALFRQSAPAANAIVLQYRQDMLQRPTWSSMAKRASGEPPDRVGLSPATVNRRLSALRSISTIAKIAGAFDGEILIKGIKSRAYRNTEGVGADGYQRIISHLDELVKRFSDDQPSGYGWAAWPRALRDRAIFRLLHDAGLRRAELVRLRECDVFADRQAILLHPKGPVGETLDWELGDDAWGALEGWLSWRGGERGPLFHAVHRGKLRALDLSTVNRIIRARGDEVGLVVRPHDLRHTAITTALDRTNGNVRMVSKFSRHANVKTVMVYDDQRQKVARAIQEMIANPEPDDDVP